MQQSTSIESSDDTDINGPHFLLNNQYSIEGTFGFKPDRIVMKSFDKVNHRTVTVIKVLIPKNPFERQHLKSAIRQLICMKHIQHPNIIKMHSAFTSHHSVGEMTNFYIIREYMDGSLKMIDKSELTHGHIKYIMEQVAVATLFLHRIGIVHRNISPTSILIDRATTHIKLCDFRLANAIEPFIDTPYIVKRHYRAPEIICNLENRINTKVDVWSIGCVLFEMLTDQTPFKGTDNFDQFRQIVKILGPPDEIFLSQVPPEIRPFLEEFCMYPVPDQIFPPNAFLPNFNSDVESCVYARDILILTLVIDSNHRIELEDLLQHPYIGFKKEELQDPEMSLRNDVRDLFAWQNYHDMKSLRQEIFQILQEFDSSDHTSSPLLI